VESYRVFVSGRKSDKDRRIYNNEQSLLITNWNSNKEWKLYGHSLVYAVIYTNLFITSAFFSFWIHANIVMYSLGLKTVDKVVCWRENCLVQVKVGHDELARIRSLLARLTSLSNLVLSDRDRFELWISLFSLTYFQK
jgi:hypothetical protein